MLSLNEIYIPVFDISSLEHDRLYLAFGGHSESFKYVAISYGLFYFPEELKTRLMIVSENLK
jgi:hypothetical protein